MTFEVTATPDLFTKSGAIFSECRLYRYKLWRRWDDRLPQLIMVMLNPSTADELLNDPTIERCQRRALRLDLGGVTVMNCFAYRATKPAAMRLAHRQGVDVIGPENDAYLRAEMELALSDGSPVVYAWGMNASFLGRDHQVATIGEDVGVEPLCMGTTEKGFPRHPLYVESAQQLVSWP